MVVCCTAGRLGWSGPWAERAAAAGEALLARGRNAAGDWIYSFDVRGEPADIRSDLYTQAFVILGFAEAGRALARADFLAAAVATRDRLREAWQDPAGGYREGQIAPHLGRQNPHMHLLEAFLALHAATRATADLAAATTIAELFMTRLLTQSDRIPEEFDAAWRPIEAAGAAPGHQFEWAWLLERLRLAGGDDRSATSHALVGFGERCGVDAAGFAVDAIGLDGLPRSTTARLWPQAERLKAALAGLGPDPDRATAEARRALAAYVAGGPVAGAWRDLRRADGGFEVRASARLQRLSYRRGRRGALAGGERLSLSHGGTAFRAPTPAAHISGGRPLKTAPKTAADTPARGAVGARERRPAPSVTANSMPRRVGRRTTC